MTATRPILPPQYLSGSLVLLALLWTFVPGPRLIAFPWNLVGLLPMFIGVTFNVAGERQFHRAETTMHPFGQPQQLVTTGVFRYSRHPMYFGLVLIVLGTAILLGYATPFAAPAMLWMVLRYRFIPHEERTMLERFGEQYGRYVNHGPRRWV
jgi:protein-S-isoprenylcysteine O-methyltransferase Ste14